MIDRARGFGLRIMLCRRDGGPRFTITLLTMIAALLCARAIWMIPRVWAATQTQNSVEVVTVSAASFIGAPAALAPNCIVSAFGTQLSTQFAPATPGVQLPTVLGGTTVDINGVRAGLLFVSSGQINFLIPAQTANGVAQVIITSTLSNGDQVISHGTINIATIAPGLFSANSDGSGPPAANTGRLDASGTVFLYDPNLPVEPDPLQPGRNLPAPIDVGTDARPAYILLYGTGVRNASLPAVHAIIGGVDAPVTYAGPQGGFVGLDQINVQLPASLKGRGIVDLTLVVSGVSSNTMKINLAGTAGAGLSVSSFSDNALAGQTVTIAGTGFSTNATDNIVRFGSTQGRVVSATSTQMQVIVPFGAESARLAVQNSNGEARSAAAFRVVTSVSGIVQNTGAPGTPPVPLEGVTVRVVGDTVSVRTNRQGTFVLSGIQPGASLIEIEGGTANASPPYPLVTLKMAIGSNRDNQFSQPISMQQPTGAATSVGGGIGKANDGFSLAKAAFNGRHHANVTTQDKGVVLDVPIGTAVKFADGKTSGQVRLTVLEKSRLPGINLPTGIYSSTIAQITPFGATFTPGATLSFPNPDPANLNAGAKVDLYRYDFQAGSFIKRGTATISANKLLAVSDGRVVDQSSYWFAAVPTGVTTVVGRVIDTLGFGIVGAQVTVNGRTDLTDHNGGFSIRDVATAGLTTIQADIVVPQQYGTPPRGASAVFSVVVSGVTNMGNIVLSATNETAIVLSPFSLDFNSTTTTAPMEVTLTQRAPTGGLKVNLTSDDTSVATVPASVTIAAGQTTASFNVTRVGTGVAFIDASATLGSTLLESFAVVSVALPAPKLTSVSPASAPARAKIVISGTGFSSKLNSNYFGFVRNGQLLTFLDPSKNVSVLDAAGKPAIRVEVPQIGPGPVTILAVIADDENGILSGISAPINFTVLPPAAAPQLISVSPTQGKPRDQVTLIGTGFGPTTAENEVTFRQNGQETTARIVQASASQLLIEVPSAQIVQGPATIIAQRLALDGSASGSSNTLNFTITGVASPPPAPTLTSVLNNRTQTASGRDGDIVTVSGSNFGKNFVNQGELGNSEPLLTVLLFYQNQQFITYTFPTAASTNGTQLTAIMPTGLAAGTTQITVITVDIDSELFSNESLPRSFTITIGSLSEIDEDEPNDSPDLATEVFLPSVVVGTADFNDSFETISLTDGTDLDITDMFFLTLDQTTNLSLNLQFNQGADLDLYLFEATPNSKGQYKLIGFSETPTGTVENILKSLPPGDYLIGINAYSGASSYKLTITQGSGLQAEAFTAGAAERFYGKAARKRK